MLNEGLLFAYKSQGFNLSSTSISIPITWKFFPFFFGNVAL